MKRMKMKKSLYIATWVLTLLLAILPQDLAAQGKKKAKKTRVITVESVVTDEHGVPVEGAVIFASEGAITRSTDASGRFSIRSKEDALILVEAEGYKDAVVNLRAGVPEKIVLNSEPYLSGERDMLDRLDGGKISARFNTSSITRVDVGKLEKYPDHNILNGLQGLAPGLIVRSASGSTGGNSSNIYVRGEHASGSTALVIVDGMERGIEDLLVEEIGSIEVIKDAAAKVLFGARATNGAIVITTKRGEANKRVIKTSVEYGVTPSRRNPEYLGASEYVNLFNEARENDGLEPYYSADYLAGLSASKGENDLLYPTINWKDYFTRSMGTFGKAVVDLNGGNSYAQYSLIAGFTGVSGTEKVGRVSSVNRFNVRGNLDIKITDFLSVIADVAGRIENYGYGAVATSTLYSHLTGARPNEYPLTIDMDQFSGIYINSSVSTVSGLTSDESGVPFFAGSDRYAQNIYADMAYGGNHNNHYVNTQTDLGLKFDFDEYVQGLKADAYITFDNYSIVNETLTKTWPTYKIDAYGNGFGGESYRLVQLRLDNRSDDIKASQTTQRTMSFRGDVKYGRTFGEHEFSTVAAVSYAKIEQSGANQDIISSNATLRFNYAFSGKYLAEVVLGAAGSNQFHRSHRYLFTPAFSLGWILSEEDFLKGNPSVDFLKLRVSGGRLGYNPGNNFLLYQTYYGNQMSFNAGPSNTTTYNHPVIVVAGNPDIGWTTSTELNAGVDGVFLGKRLSVEANVFTELRAGIITLPQYNHMEAIGEWLPYSNVNSVRNNGVELGLQWTDRALGGDFGYTLGLNFTATRNRYVTYAETVKEEARMYTGHPTSRILGLESEGLFGRDVALDGHALQTYGLYGNGNIAYKDQNGDGLIDSSDQITLGQTFPLTSWGFNVDLRWKNWGLYMNFTAETGASAIMNSTYFWNYGYRAWSVQALDRYHEVYNPGGAYPKLTTVNEENDYISSSFWLRKTDFLRFKDLELSYTIQNLSGEGIVKKCRVFARGTNLFVLTPLKYVDPEVPTAGISNNPYYSAVTAGVSVTF